MVPFLMAMFALIPLMTGLFARSFGRSFWRWFVIGTFLPAASFFILYWVTRNDEEPETVHEAEAGGTGRDSAP